MNRSPIVLAALLSLGVLVSCDDDSNPSRLYLALLASELNVQLVTDEPPPF